MMELEKQVDESVLAQSSSVFYGRMRWQEAQRVMILVKGFYSFMDDVFFKEKQVETMVAGVGSILRHSEPRKAKDIDLVVVSQSNRYNHGYGRKPTSDPVPSDIESFNRMVSEYKQYLGRTIPNSADWRRAESVDSAYVRDEDVRAFKAIDFSRIRSAGLEGVLMSRGFHISFRYFRDIDVQFVFGMTIPEWKELQENISREGVSRNGKSLQYYYSRLSGQDASIYGFTSSISADRTPADRGKYKYGLPKGTVLGVWCDTGKVVTL